MKEKIYRTFVNEFQRDPLLVRSPGRINLIGEHTDYNDGYVLPAAIDMEIIFATAKREDNLFRVFSYNLDDYFECPVDGIRPVEKGWPNYLLGVLDRMIKTGLPLGGLDCAFGGDIPAAAGMSSSAAVECGFAFSLNQLFQMHLDRMAIALLARQAEHDFSGVQCGIMDQFANMYGKKDHAVLLDCRTLEHRYVPLEDRDLRIVLCDTGVRRRLAVSDYNARREQCSRGVGILKRYDGGIENLRDVSKEFLEGHKNAIDPVTYRCCRYVVHENARVLSFCEALDNGDFAAAGNLMLQSHRGLRDEYGVSCIELDRLVESARKVEGVYGSRMMGAGFGGCTINLVNSRSVDAMTRLVKEDYRKLTGYPAAVYTCGIEEGTAVLD